MTKVEVELDDETARRLRAGAEAQGRTFDDFLREQIASLPAARDPFRALNWDDVLIDRIIDDTMTARETHPLRASCHIFEIAPTDCGVAGRGA